MSIGQYPQDTPQQEPIAVIYRLSEGYVLMIRGRTVACPSVHALSQAINKQVRALESEPLVMMDQGPPVPPDWKGIPPGPAPFEVAAQTQPFADPMTGMLLQRSNLVQSAKGLVEGKINEEQFNLARRQFFPDVDDATVLSVAQSFGWASSRVVSTSFEQEVAELERAQQGWVMRPEPPDLEGEEDDPEIDPDLPVQVVDLAAGREGRRAARVERATQMEMQWPEEPEPKAKPKRGRRKRA